MPAAFDPNAYRDLLVQVTPRVIESEQEYDRLLAVAERLTFQKEQTPEERTLYRLVVMLIESYEAEHHPMRQAPPHEVLQHLMDSKGVRQAELVGIVGSRGVVSEVVNGKRSISKRQAKALGGYFGVSPTLFL